MADLDLLEEACANWQSGSPDGPAIVAALAARRDLEAVWVQLPRTGIHASTARTAAVRQLMAVGDDQAALALVAADPTLRDLMTVAGQVTSPDVFSSIVGLTRRLSDLERLCVLEGLIESLARTAPTAVQLGAVLELARSLPNLADRTRVLSGLGAIYLEQGDREGCLQCLELALAEPAAGLDRDRLRPAESEAWLEAERPYEAAALWLEAVRSGGRLDLDCLERVLDRLDPPTARATAQLILEALQRRGEAADLRLRRYLESSPTPGSEPAKPSGPPRDQELLQQIESMHDEGQVREGLARLRVELIRQRRFHEAAELEDVLGL